MRYELSEYEWSGINPMLPNKPRGVPRLRRSSRAQWHLVGPAFGSRGAICRRTMDILATIASLDTCTSMAGAAGL
jgi:transposase